MPQVLLPVSENRWQKDLIQTLEDYFNILEDQIEEARRPNIETITSDKTVAEFENTILVDATSSAVTVTLPSPEKNNKRVIAIKKIDNINNVTVSGTIDGSSSKTLTTQYETVRVHSDGVQWWET